MTLASDSTIDPAIETIVVPKEELLNLLRHMQGMARYPYGVKREDVDSLRARDRLQPCMESCAR